MDYQKTNKQNITKWKNTVKYLTKIFNSENIEYYLSASGLNYIQGSNIYPYDTDLFMSKENVEKTFILLKEYQTSNLHYWEEDSKKLLEFQGVYNDIPFEICEWEEQPIKLEIVEFEDISISIIG